MPHHFAPRSITVGPGVVATKLVELGESSLFGEDNHELPMSWMGSSPENPRLRWFPKWTPEQWAELSPHIDSTWRDDLYDWDFEDIKTWIRSIDPKVQFVGC